MGKLLDEETGLCSETTDIRAQLPPERWREVVAQARHRAQVVRRVLDRHAAGQSLRSALRDEAPDVPWPTFRHWVRCERERPGQPWERQLDRRIPPEPSTVDPAVRAAACLLRRVQPGISCKEARRLLVQQFGDKGNISDPSLKRFWSAEGLNQPAGPTSQQTVTHHAGGGGLAFMAAAAAETESVEALAKAVLEQARQVVAAQEANPPVSSPAVEGRDAQGRITGAYNRAMRNQGERDPRRDSDAQKRSRRPLSTIEIARSRVDVVADKLLSMGVTPLLTERRGFDGLEGPSGAWLEVLGGTAYMPATLDRDLSELALLDVADTLWMQHGQQWEALTRTWREGEDAPHWLRQVVYVDATQDPYWTRQYASSGKISRVGRVMPCLSRVALMGGEGVPLIVETHAGTVSLKTELLPFLDRCEGVLGSGELGRLTVIDAEMATIPLLSALSERPEQAFITVLKGSVQQGAQRSEEGSWQRYRDRDLVRELVVHLEGPAAPEGGLRLRAVEMVREGSRNPTSTVFATNATPEMLSTEEVPDAYLSRWPHQEQRFRDGRNGLGLERSHGYGGEVVTHVALETRKEKADKQVERAQARLVRLEEAERKAQALLESTERGHREAAQLAVQRAKRDRKEIERRLARAQEERKHLETTPREIYVRDTTRDSIVTCAKLTVLMLIEFVLKEYFGGARMEVRTFIESFVSLPVTVRETAREVLYQLHENPRSPKQAQWLREACAEVTRREVQARGKRLRFEVIAAGPAG